MTTTLLAVTGLSTAIVTETVWALAKDEGIIPDRVVFITTASGARMLEDTIFTPREDWGGATVWECLRQAVAAAPGQLIAEPAQVITLADGASGRAIPLDDLRTPAENAAAAEFIFARVWDIVRDKDRRLYASVAGGRKTMGALLHAAVSLIGREDDRISHVLVSPPFDTLPGFFFPDQPAFPLHHTRTGCAHLAADAEIHLAELPFVPLRNRFRELDELPGSFLGLRDKLAATLANDAEREVPIRLEPERGRFFVDGSPYRANLLQIAVLEFILRCQIKKQQFNDQAKAPQEAAAEAFVKWLAKHSDRYPGLKLDLQRGARLITHPLSELRTKLKNASWQPSKGSFVQAPFRLEA